MNKNTRNLLIVFAVLLIIVYFFFRGKEKESTQNIDEKLFEVDSAKIEKIEIIKTGGTIVLEKVNGVWMMTQPINYPADTTQITPLLSDLQNFKIESEVSSNPARYNTYLDSVNNTKVVVWQDGKAAGSFILGKGKGADLTYIQPDAGKPIYEASKLSQANFVKKTSDFRNKLIMSIPNYTVMSVNFKSDDSVKYDFTLAKDTAGKWYIGPDSVNEITVSGFLNYLNNLQTEDFIDSAVSQFPPLTYQVSVKATNTNADIFFHKVKAEQPYYIVRVSNNPQLYKMTTSFATMILKQRKDFIPEPPPKTDATKKQ